MRFLAYILGALYFIAPFDLIPDFLGLFGRIDDLLLILGIVYYFRKYFAQNQSFLGNSANFKKTTTDSGSSSSNLSKEACYQVLEISQETSKAEITKQYKKLMSQYHPDKVDHLGIELKTLAKEKTILIQRAYEKLNES